MEMEGTFASMQQNFNQNPDTDMVIYVLFQLYDRIVFGSHLPLCISNSLNVTYIIFQKGSAAECFSYCRNPGLNQGPLDLQSNALPTELFRPTRKR